ncbi:MAG: transcriptional repressor [Clostridia bacterium]|nr:transcriptional repressor [Clostridia bacterium]
MAEELQNKGIRPSHQRLKVLEYFHMYNNHPTVEEIYQELKPTMPTLTKATIYNTLKIFVEKKFVDEVHIEDNEVRFDLHSKNHGHFKCTQCGTIYDFQIEMDQVPVEDLNEFQIETKNVYFKGVCPKCLSNIVSKK